MTAAMLSCSMLATSVTPVLACENGSAVETEYNNIRPGESTASGTSVERITGNIYQLSDTTKEKEYVISEEGKDTCYFQDMSGKIKYVAREDITYFEKTEKANRSLTTYTEEREDDFFNDCSTNYGFSQLDNYDNAVELETLYVAILAALRDTYESTSDIESTDFGGEQYYCGAKVEYGSLGLTAKEISDVFTSVAYDHPLIYFMNTSVILIYDGIDMYLIIDEIFASGDMRQTYADKIQSAVKEFDEITKDCNSNYSIAKSVHDAIIERVDYAVSEDGPILNNSYIHNISGYVSDEKEVVCDGYSRTYQAVMNYLDIDTVLVTGWGVEQGLETPDYTAHAWNMVKLGDGKYYFVDVTWDDLGDYGVSSDYFCLGEELYRSHSVIQNNTSGSNHFLYNLPDINYPAFSGEDILVKEKDPEYVIMNTINFDVKDGVMTFTGKGGILRPEENVDGEWYQYKDEVTKLVFDEGITFIGDFAFMNFEHVTEISFPAGLKGIGQQAFYGCSSLTEVVLPDEISFFDSEIFGNCAQLKKVTFGEFTQGTFIYANMNMFRFCKNLDTIIVPEGNKRFASIDNVLIDKTNGTIIAYPAGKKNTVYEIPDSIQTIGSWAFVDCDNLQEVTIPDSVQIVGDFAFQGCDSLVSLSFPSSVKQFYFSEETYDVIVSSCKNLQYIENKSDAKMKLSSGEYCHDGDDSKYWKYWQDSETGQLLSEFSNGIVYPKYYGRIKSKNEYFEVNGVTYLVTSEPSINLSVSEMNAGAAIGQVSAIRADAELFTDYSIPEKIECDDWIYNVAEISEEVLAVLKNNKKPPVVEGIEDGKTYCGEAAFTVTDTDLSTVTIDGNSVDAEEGGYTVGGDGQEHTIVATDKAGNKVTINITVYAGHQYAEPEFTWSTDKKTAGANFLCSVCGSKETVAATVTSKETAATCTAEGKTEYTATVTFDGKTYTDRKEVPIAKKPHQYAEPEFTWSTDKKTAGANFLCSVCGSKETVAATVTSKETAATCTAEGKTEYTATVTFDGKTYTDRKEVPIAKKPHQYAEPEFTWSTDKKTAGANFLCSVCGSKETVAATVTSKETAATCTAEGKTEYTATVTFDGKTYTDRKEVPIAKKLHTYVKTVTAATTEADGSVMEKCAVCGSVNNKTAIAKIGTVTLSKTIMVYTGKALEPSVTVNDGTGKAISSQDYTVTYKNNKAVGTASITITFKENYSGTITKNFTICPKTAKLAAISAKSKGFQAKWKKVTGISRYEVQCSLSAKFPKKKTVTKNVKASKKSLKVGNLKKKRKYYVRIRTYKTVKGEKIYSGWSTVKKVMTKK